MDKTREYSKSAIIYDAKMAAEGYEARKALILRASFYMVSGQ